MRGLETKPGDLTERGCAFLGCRVVICGQIENVIHLVHSPVGCAYYSWDYRVDSKGFCFTTDLNELDVIFGGEKKLLIAIDEAIEEFKPDAVFVYQTCTTGLIGDDIVSIARIASEKHGIPVIAFECAGFRGKNQNFGHKIATKTLMQLMEDGMKEEGTGKEKIISNGLNLIGDFNRADAKALERMLEGIGLRVLCSFTAGSNLQRLKSMKYARLNVVQCSKSSIQLAEFMEETLGTPYVEANFFGIKNCVESLKRIAEYFDIDVDEFCRREIERIDPRLEFYRARLEGKKVFICHGLQRVLYWIEPLKELGMEIVGVATYMGDERDMEKLRELVGDVEILYNPSVDVLGAKLIELNPDLVISDDKIRYVAHKLSIPFINGRGQGKAYSGFEGFLRFAEDVYRCLNVELWRLGKCGL